MYWEDRTRVSERASTGRVSGKGIPFLVNRMYLLVCKEGFKTGLIDTKG